MMRRAVFPVLSLLLVIGAVVYVLSTNGSDQTSPAADESAATQAVSQQPDGSEADCPTPAEPPPPEAAPPPPPPDVAMMLPCGPGESEPAASAPNHP